jgi:RNA polymerase sigma-70 factor, ECF subfamily
VSEPRPPLPDELSAAVDAARSGDERAFRTVYRAVQPRLLRYLRVLVGDDADDVASETWLQIARGLRTFDGDGDAFRGWAATIARHRALDHLRYHRRRPAILVPPDQLRERPGVDDTEGQALTLVSTSAALALIGSLPRDQAEAVLLRTVMGLDANTAAAVVGKRAGAVRTSAYRGLRRLAERLRTPAEPATPDVTQPAVPTLKRTT